MSVQVFEKAQVVLGSRIRETKDIELIGVQLNSAFKHNLLLPFDNIKDTTTRLNWWDAYNNLKHSEMQNYQDGCLTNVLYGMASLAVLYALMSKGRGKSRLFTQIGYFTPLETVRTALFPK